MLARPLVLLDGLLGTGATGALREPLRSLAAEMAGLHQSRGARVAAVDLPSGVDPDTGEAFPGASTADVTFMIANAKHGLLTGRAAGSVGALALVPVPALTSERTSDLEIIAPQTGTCAKAPRPFDFHKGMAGRVAVLAGSTAFTGAAVLAATGALRGGGGLVTLHVPSEAAQTIAMRCPPEIMIRGYQNPREVLESRCDAIVAGCGMGELAGEAAAGLLEVIQRSDCPLVLDADALNLLARENRLDLLTERHLLTPHPGEFSRLAPDLADLPREQAVRRFIERHPFTLLLKGARTVVARRGAPLWCNSTGTPAMATGGHGDFLAGVIGARLAIGDDPLSAASLGAWICGRAAELAVAGAGFSEESLAPTDMEPWIGRAFDDWRGMVR